MGVTADISLIALKISPPSVCTLCLCSGVQQAGEECKGRGEATEKKGGGEISKKGGSP